MPRVRSGAGCDAVKVFARSRCQKKNENPRGDFDETLYLRVHYTYFTYRPEVARACTQIELRPANPLLPGRTRTRETSSIGHGMKRIGTGSIL